MLAFYEFTDYSFHIVVVFNVSYIYIYILSITSRLGKSVKFPTPKLQD